jgi:hypothetical protein
VRLVVNRKEVVVRALAAPRERIGRVLAPKSVAKFDVSGAQIPQAGRIA